MTTYAGSLDNGATDTEYTPTPERLMSAADETFATKKELDEVVSDTCDVQDELEARIVDLETQMAWVHEQLRPELPEPESEMPSDLTVAYMKGYEDGRAAVVRTTKGDYAHIPAAKWKFICDELETLRAFRDSVPWDALGHMWKDADSAESLGHGYTSNDELTVADAWLAANAPKPEAAK